MSMDGAGDTPARAGSVGARTQSGGDPAAVAWEQEETRRRAIKFLKRRGDFRAHVLVFIVTIVIVIVIWRMAGGEFFWLAFVIGVWWVVLTINFCFAYRRDPSENAITHRIERLNRGAR